MITPRFGVFQAFSIFNHVLQQKGFSVAEEPLCDDLVLEMRDAGKKNVGAPLRRDTTDLTERTSFWLTLRKDGALIGVLGARVDEVDDKGLGDFVERQLRRYWCQPGVSDVSVTMPKHLDLTVGQIVYMGDFFFREDSTGDREKTFAFVHCAHAYAFHLWPSAQFCYAFMRMSDYLDNVATYGFTSGSFINVANWVNPPHYRSEHECLSLIKRDDFLSNIRALANNPEIASGLPERQTRRARAEEAKMHLQSS